MPRLKRVLNVESITYAANALTTRQLPLSVYRGLWLNLSATFSSATGPAIDVLLKMITKINVVLNGQDTLISVPFYHLYYMNRADFSIAPVSLGTSGTVTNAQVSVYLPFGLTRAAAPQDTLLDARRLSTVTLEVQWATLVGFTVSAASLSVDTVEYDGIDRAQGFGRHEFGFDSMPLSKTGLNQNKLETSGLNQYRRLFVYTWNSSAALNNSQIDNLELKTRNYTFLKKNATLLQNTNNSEFAIAPATGLYILDLTSDGKMSERIDAGQMSELILEVNSLVSNGTMDIVKEKAIFAETA